MNSHSIASLLVGLITNSIFYFQILWLHHFINLPFNLHSYIVNTFSSIANFYFEPFLKLRGFNQAFKGGPLVLFLCAIGPALSYSSTFGMSDSNSCVTLILVLATWTTSPKCLNYKILFSQSKQ